MLRIPILSLLLLVVLPAFAATGGPDAYGYIWKDSNEPDGPVFNWIDITTTGTLVTGLADDNVVGPFFMTTNQSFYWYDVKKVWIGSNGYLAFNNVNIASPFPLIPTAGGANDYIAGFMADLNFSGAGNPAQCWYQDDGPVTIISYVNVPFWSSAAPSYTGSNTFQFILNKVDSTITVQFLAQTGITQNQDITIGIESVTGDIGLQHSFDTYPPTNYAIRYYNPAVPLLDVSDASVEWNTSEGNRGLTLARFGPDLDMTTNVKNTGNVDVGPFQVTASLKNTVGTVLATDQITVNLLIPGQDTTITYPTTWAPNSAGTYQLETTISGIPGELVVSNNTRIQEVLVYDTALAVLNIDWAGPTDDGLGIGWDGGNGGVGTYVEFPYYPAYVSATTVRISSNTGLVGYYMKIYDDDGLDGAPGTLLDSVFVPAAMGGQGDHVHPLSAPLTVTDGGVYVQWYMGGQNVNIAEDNVGPFSLRSYEVLDGVWAEYRDKDIADFHLGVQVTAPPVFDAGCTSYFGLINGLNVGGPTTIRTWVRNFGNQAINNFPVNYRFESEPVVTQTYNGPAIAPGDSSLVTFSQVFTPTNNGPGVMCSWVDHPQDQEQLNDTVCVSININVGIEDLFVDALSLRPNPTTGPIVIEGFPGQDISLALFDAQGREVLNISRNGVGERLVLDLGGLPNGHYHYRTIAEGNVYTGRIVVQR